MDVKTVVFVVVVGGCAMWCGSCGGYGPGHDGCGPGRVASGGDSGCGPCDWHLLWSWQLVVTSMVVVMMVVAVVVLIRGW